MHKSFHKNICNGGGADSRLCRHHVLKDKGFDVSHFLPDPSPSSPDRAFAYTHILPVY
uniref:Uncharacterized protein n=1 Tax=Rhizophora mucronata TaxID=61149 RepID=A0A2P2Q5C1_RHIMU